jgi:hypothetical protein
MVAAFLRCPSGLVSNKLGSPPFKGMKVPDVLDVSHFVDTYNSLASGGKGEAAKDWMAPGAKSGQGVGVRLRKSVIVWFPPEHLFCFRVISAEDGTEPRQSQLRPCGVTPAWP